MLTGRAVAAALRRWCKCDIGDGASRCQCVIGDGACW